MRLLLLWSAFLANTLVAAGAGARQPTPTSVNEAVPVHGSWECSCLTEPVGLAALKSMQTAYGFPPSYGLGGCKAYDADPQSESHKKATGCTGGPADPDFCNDPWCYVDPIACGSDQVACKAAGGVMGSYTHPACREKEMSQSHFFRNATVQLFYSYHTCGAMDSYTNTSIQDSVAGREFTVVVNSKPFAPYTYPKDYVQETTFDKEHPVWKGTSGALVKLVDAIAFDFNPTLKIRVLDGFGSAQSRQKFSSPFTACCMDVAVAKTDMCIGDFWVTHGRLSMGISFLLPFGSDEFYVVAPRVEIMSSASWFNTMFDMLAAPWKPFTFDLWICFFAFIFFTSLVTLLTDGIFDVGDEFEDHEDTDDFENPTAVGMYCKSLYLNFLGYVSCSPMNAPSSVPGRLAALGFGWFLLIVISSYTANLAAILVEQKNPQNSIASIDDAIQQGRTICLVREIHKELTSKFPGAKLKLKLSTEAVIRGLKTKHCDVGVLTDQQIKKLFSGEYNERDCEKIENMTDAEAADLETGAVCIRDEDGNPDAKSDCGKFAKVGLPVVSVPLSMPVSDELQASFSYTYRKLQAEGEFNRMLKEEEARVAGKLGSACGLHSRDGDESLQLPLSSLAGTFIIAIFIQFVALLLSAIEYKSGKTLQEMLGLYNHVLDGHEERVRNRQQRAMEKSHALTVAEFEKFLVDFRKLEARLKDPEKPGASSAEDSTIPAIDAQAKGSTTDGRRVVHAGATSVHPIIADGNLQPQKVMDPKQTSSDFILMTSNSEAPHAVSQVQTVLSTPRTILPPPRSNPPSVHSERRWAHEEFTATAHGEFTPYVAQNGNVDGGLRSSDIRAYYSVSLANNSIPVSR